MKIAIFSLCKNRLLYTKKFLKGLEEKTGLEYDHFIIDQASTDETVEWLENNQRKLKVYPLGKNIGINRGVNFALDRIGNNYDVIVKMDNDAEVITEGWLQKILSVLKKKEVLSPVVLGLVHNRGGVDRYQIDTERGVGLTPFVGGICMVAYRKAWEDSQGWEYPAPLHAGGDRAFCLNLSLEGYRFGYKEDVFIRHMETTSGQENRFPEYFNLRKHERKTIL